MDNATSTSHDDLGFLALPGAVMDWRAVVLIEAATESGLLDALPGTATAIAGQAGTDARATRVVLESLVVYGVVAEEDGGFTRGPAAPDASSAAVLHQHAGVITRWATTLQDRLRGDAPPERGDRSQQDLGRWLDSLGARARERAPQLVDACLAAVPDPVGVLDLGGGHGEYALEFADRGLDVTMQDRPEVIDLARDRGRLEGAGVNLFAGDFHQAMAPGPFDLVLLAGVAHTYPEAGIRRLYQQVRPVVSRSLVISTFTHRADDRTRLFAIQMLTVGNGADTHARDDHASWLRDADFKTVDVRPTPLDTTELIIASV